MTDYILSFDPGTKNIAYCLLESKTRKIVAWDVLSIEHKSYEGRCRNLNNELNKRKLLKDLPKGSHVSVVIEQQMGINTKTNRICGMLIMYYTINNDLIKKIVHYPAKYKANYYRWKIGDPAPFKGMSKGKKKKVEKS